MFHVLIESGAHPGERRAGWTVSSVVAHAALVAVAVILTLRPPTRPSSEDEIFVEVAPWQDPKPNTGDTRSGTSGTTLAPPTIDIPIPPIGIEQVTIGRQSIIPTDLFDDRPSGGTGTSPARPGPVGIYTDFNVDRPVAPRADNGSPVYPAILRSASIEGDVAVRFIVDSTGRVETSSIVILEASHSAFADAVRRWLLRARYQPAEVSGQPVRQLVEQRFGFTLRR